MENLGTLATGESSASIKYSLKTPAKTKFSKKQDWNLPRMSLRDTMEPFLPMDRLVQVKPTQWPVHTKAKLKKVSFPDASSIFWPKQKKKGIEIF